MNSTREAYGQALAELGEKYPIYVFDADLSKATQTVHFAKKFPERFTNMGIAESNMIGYAAGYAACGATVFASTSRNSQQEEPTIRFAIVWHIPI